MFEFVVYIGMIERISSLSKYYVYTGCIKKKGNRTLQCSSVFIIQSTEIILSQAERPGF